MSRNVITVKNSISINKPRETVWEFTQNYDNRVLWDYAVKKVEVLQNIPTRIVKLEMFGGSIITFVYKLDDKPNKTSLATKDVKSTIINSGGGAWKYESAKDGTVWTQVNSLVLKNSYWLTLFRPIIKEILFIQTKLSMQRAKRLMEL